MTLRDSTLSGRQAILEDALAVLRREFRRNLRLDDVAREIGTSRRQLQRILADAGGPTFRDLLTEIRLDSAAELLRISDLPVGLVARAVGYDAPTHFRKAFRERHGTSPSDYRERISSSLRPRYG